MVKKPMDILQKDNENEPINRSKCTDLTYLKQRTKSNPKLIMEMIALYLQQTPPLIKAMKQGLEDKNWESVQAAAHKMIPSFSIVGISKDYEDMAKKIQEYAKTDHQRNEIPNLVLALEKICAQACSELEEELKVLN